MTKLSVVINTLNEEKNLPRVLRSIKNIADEIVVVDMKSDDRTVQIAKNSGAKVYDHDRVGYVEPARNFAIAKATGDWILIVDADEEIPESLGNKIRDMVKKPKADYIRIPRKNINFGKWIQASRWWPDYNIRLFKKGSVIWNEIIHSVPMTVGEGMDLPPEEKYAIIHHNYSSISSYIERMNRYSGVQAELCIKNGYRFNWTDLIKKPMGEFMGRFFAGEGYKDGLHGFALSVLQGFSEFCLYLKIWEEEKFEETGINREELENVIRQSGKELKWWMEERRIKEMGIIPRTIARIIRKVKHG